MSRFATVIAALGLALSATTAQSGPPIYAQIDGPDVTGSIQSSRDSFDILVNVTSGRNLFVGFNNDSFLQATVTDPFGVLVHQELLNDNYHGDSGFELHPTSSGVFHIKLIGDPTSAIFYPTAFDVWVWSDCPNVSKGGCAIKPGQTRVGTWGGRNDTDRFVIVGPSGHKYAATLTDAPNSGIPYANISVVDKNGGVVAHGVFGGGAPRSTSRTVRFAISRSLAPYTIIAAAEPNIGQNRGSYTLFLREY